MFCVLSNFTTSSTAQSMFGRKTENCFTNGPSIVEVVSGKLAVISIATPCWYIRRCARQTISFSVFHWQTNIFQQQRVIETVHFVRRQYTAAMIAGAHFLLYSKDPEADRAFFKTVLEFPSVDLGDGWLIFAWPPAELAVHPEDGELVQLHAEHPMLGGLRYLIRDDLVLVVGMF